MKNLLSIVIIALALQSCNSKNETSNDRSRVNEVLSDHGYPVLPASSAEHNLVISKHEKFDEYDIRFSCSIEGFSLFLSKVPALGFSLTQVEIEEALRTQRPEIVWRARRSSDEPNYAYLESKRKVGDIIEVTLEFEDIK